MRRAALRHPRSIDRRNRLLSLMLCIGHRGAAGHAPENTLRSFEHAIRLGAPWVECDVHLVEGELVVFHDDRLERTTNGSGLLAKRTFSYLRTLDAGQGERIPTLEEVLDLVEGRAGLNVELKGPNTADAVVRILRQRISSTTWRAEALQVSSFSPGLLSRAHRLAPELPIGALFERRALQPLRFARRLGASTLNVSLGAVTPRLVRRAHRAGLGVWVYTVNEPNDIRRMRQMDVDAVFSDYPDRVLARPASDN